MTIKEIFPEFFITDRPASGIKPIKWESPLKQYHFIFGRPLLGKGAVYINIYDSIGVELSRIQTNETVLFEFIEYLLNYMYELINYAEVPDFNFQIQSGFDIFLISIDIDQEYFEHAENNIGMSKMYYDDDMDLERCICFKIQKYNSLHDDKLIPIMVTPVSFGDLYFLVDTGLEVLYDMPIDTDSAQHIGLLYEIIFDACSIR